MKKLNLKLIAAALITTMLIPMGSASAAGKSKKNNKNQKTQISQQDKNADVDKDDEEDKEDEKQSSNKWDWKIEKEKAKSKWKIEKEKAKADWKIKKEESKAEVKKTKEEAKKALTEQKTVIKENNNKTHELKEDIIDIKKEITEVIGYISKSNIIISEDISKQIKDRLEMIKGDVEAINSSRGIIDNIYVDIKAQLENKDANGVGTGIENVLSIQEQRYLSLQKLNDDLQVLLTLLEHAKKTPLPATTTTTPAADTSTDGQATSPVAGSETSTLN